METIFSIPIRVSCQDNDTGGVVYYASGLPSRLDAGATP